MTALTFPYPPGFADIPDSSLAAEQYAQGILIGRIAENIAMGIVRTEVFVKTYNHGETVDLPISTVDGYQYSRAELNYMWGVLNLENPSTGQNSINDRYAFGQWFVNQDTGVVTIEKFYSNDSGSHQEKTNDGQLYVYTFGQRNKGSMTLTAPPSYHQYSDSEYSVDSPLRTTPLTALSNNAKYGVVSTETIYMGTYKSLDVVAAPHSPIDGYAYSTTEIIWLWSWVWNTKADAFVNPMTYKSYYTQMDQMRAHIDPGGQVHINIHFRTDYDQNAFDLFGRISVMALCTRTIADAPTGGSFAWVDPNDLAPGAPLRGDLLTQLNKNAAVSALRPEFFNAGDFTNGQTVPLPVSAVDGYTYTRDEIIYLWEMGDTGLNLGGNIRILDWKAWVYFNGLVAINMLHMRTGGYPRWDNEGALRVKILAIRSSTIGTSPPATPWGPPLPGVASDPPVISPTGSFTVPGQETADGWTPADVAGTGTLGSGDPVSGTNLSQSISVNAGAGNSAGIVSTRIPVYITDRYIATWKAKSNVDITTGWIIRVFLFNDDQTESVYFDIYSGALSIVVVYPKPIWEVPVSGDAIVKTSFGGKAVVGTLDFDPRWASIEALVFEPDVTCTVLVADINLIKTELKLDNVTIDDDGYGTVSATAGTGGGTGGHTEPLCFNGEILFLNGDVLMIGVDY